MSDNQALDQKIDISADTFSAIFKHSQKSVEIHFNCFSPSKSMNIFSEYSLQFLRLLRFSKPLKPHIHFRCFRHFMHIVSRNLLLPIFCGYILGRALGSFLLQFDRLLTTIDIFIYHFSKISILNLRMCEKSSTFVAERRRHNEIVVCFALKTVKTFKTF